MIVFLYRIGPMFIAELVFLNIGVVSLLFGKLFPCLGYTFLQLALQLFLIELVVVFRMIKKDKKLRVKYIGKDVFASKRLFLQRFVWNTIWIWGIILGLAYWMIIEGLTLSNTSMESSQKIYTLYPVCYFSDLANHPQTGKQFGMIINFLYACNVIMNLLLITFTIREFYHHYQTIKRNRKFFFKNSVQKSESLLDCKIIDDCPIQETIKDSLISQQQEGLECGICLRKFCKQKIIKLRCSHHFHQQCINLWLKVKDSCPYRCG